MGGRKPKNWIVKLRTLNMDRIEALTIRDLERETEKMAAPAA